jgi:hypothetical protein
MKNEKSFKSKALENWEILEKKDEVVAVKKQAYLASVQE